MSLRTRTRSAGANRGSAMSADVNMLKQTIKTLQEQLMTSRAETQKVREQLACLSLLVKKAWTGEKAAVHHVAAIIGMAPPEIKVDNDSEESHLVITTQPKSHVLNNWARLAIGVLNKQYCHLERDLEDQQKRHLLNRSEYLDGHLQVGYARPANSDRWEIVQNPATRPTPSRPGSGKNPSRVSSAKKKPTIRHLYRPANPAAVLHDPDSLQCGSMSNTNGDFEERDYAYAKLPKRSLQRQTSYDSYQDESPDYADPYKYSVNGLFDEGVVLGRDAMARRQRPPSGREQRQADAVRSRPRSAVLSKGERPLKYETTRPLSSKPRARPVHSASTGDIHGSQRKHSGDKQWVKGHTFITSGLQDEVAEPERAQPISRHLTTPNGLQQQHNPQHSGESDDEAESWHSEDEELAARKRAIEKILVKLKKPESVIHYEEELLRLGLMEQDFKANTLQLQKKLGIPSSAFVEP